MHVFTYTPGHQGATLTQHTARGTRRTSCITLAAKADNFRTAGPDRPACVISTGPWMVLDDGPVYTSALIRAEFATTPASPWCQWDAVPHNAVIDGWGWGGVSATHRVLVRDDKRKEDGLGGKRARDRERRLFTARLLHFMEHCTAYACRLVQYCTRALQACTYPLTARLCI